MPGIGRSRRIAITTAFAALALPASVLAGEADMNGAGNGGEHISICHALGNGGYNQIAPDATGVLNGHYGDHHQDGRDIIPPFTYDGKDYSQNWDETGQAIFNNDCEVPDPTVTPEPTEPVETVTPEPTEPVETVTPEPTEPVETVTPEPTEPVETVTPEPTEPVETVTPEPTTPAETFTPAPTEPAKPVTPAPTQPAKDAETPKESVKVSSLPETGTGSGSDTALGVTLAAAVSSILAGVGYTVRRRR